MAKRKPAPAATQRIDVKATIDPEALLFIMQQTANAHSLLAQVKKQQAAQKKAATPVPGTPGTPPAGPTPAQQKAAAQQQQQQQNQQRRQKAAGLALIGSTIRALPGGTRSPGRTAAGRFHNNLADLPLLPLVIAIAVVAIVLMPVFQGYTRLDLLFMVLSGDAHVPIPVRGSGQNYEQALASPPDTSGGSGGVGNPNWWQAIGGAAGAGIGAGIGAATGLSDTNNSTPSTQANYPGGSLWVD